MCLKCLLWEENLIKFLHFLVNVGCTLCVYYKPIHFRCAIDSFFETMKR